MIEALGLSKDYGEIQALKDARFLIPANEVVGLLGPNGAGKTTLMKILTGYLHPSSGKAQIDGIDVLEDPTAVKAKIGYLPESAPLYPDMAVQEYLQMITELREIPQPRQRSLISEAVYRTGLKDDLVRPIGQLSKGYRQRVGLAQAILHEPKVLILDEPTSGLDPSQIVEIRQLIKDLSAHATVLLSTHILPEVEMTCERVLIINHGEVRADAKLDELRASNAAVVSVQGPREDVKSALEGMPEVEDVGAVPGSNGFSTFRVAGESDELCLRLFDVVRDHGWRIAELRPDTQTLETVFRHIVDDEGRAS